MDESNLKRTVRIAIGFLCLFLIGLTAAVVIIAVNRSSPVVLIPFALATLVSFEAIWWAQRRGRKPTASPPVSEDKRRRMLD